MEADVTEATNQFPRGPLFGMFALVALGLVAAVAGRLTHTGPAPATGSVVATRDLRFADGPEGSVVITDARDGRTVEVLTGENGFVRGTLRGLARTRRAEGIGHEPPFRLTAWSDGRLTLDDTATPQHIELQAFGPDNTVVFGRMLTGGAGQ